MRAITMLLAICLISGSTIAEEGVTETSILFGSSLPLTGELAKRGAEYKVGAELALKKINSQGGVNGRKIEVQVLDDGYVPQKSAENVRTLLEKNKVFGYFQVLGTPSVKAIEPMLKDKKIPLVAPLTGGMSFRQPPNPYIISIRPGFSSEAKTLVDYLVKRGSKKIGFYYQDDSLGTEGKTAVTQALAAHGLKRLADHAYKRGSIEENPGIDTFKKAGVDTVIMWATEKPSTNFILKATKAGLKVTFAGSAVSLGPDSLNDLANVKADIFISQPNSFYSLKQPQILKDYTEEAKAANQSPNQNGYEGYVNMMFLAEAIKRAGPNITRDGLIKTVEDMRSISIGGLDFDFSPTDHEGLSTVLVSKVEGQKVQTVQ